VFLGRQQVLVQKKRFVGKFISDMKRLKNDYVLISTIGESLSDCRFLKKQRQVISDCATSQLESNFDSYWCIFIQWFKVFSALALQ
jgi:hypothetical protein